MVNWNGLIEAACARLRFHWFISHWILYTKREMCVILVFVVITDAADAVVVLLLLLNLMLLLFRLCVLILASHPWFALQFIYILYSLLLLSSAKNANVDNDTVTTMTTTMATVTATTTMLMMMMLRRLLYANVVCRVTHTHGSDGSEGEAQKDWMCMCVRTLDEEYHTKY